MASEAYSLTDGNWPDRSVSLRRLLDQSKLGRRSGLHLGAQSTAPKEPEVPKASGVEPLTAQPPEVSKVTVFEPLTAQVRSRL